MRNEVQRSLALLIGFVVMASCAPLAPASDVRRFSDGHRIPDQGYCDQPYLVVTKDGNWLCTMTTGAGREGDRGQHVVATISKDRGRTWSELIDIEPADGTEASWVVPLITPRGRVYAFYTYNGDGVGHGKPEFALPDKGATYRADIVGWYCYRYSDDHGRSWSERTISAAAAGGPRVTGPINGRGEFRFSGESTSLTRQNGVAFFAFTRLGRFFLDDGEGWLFRSSNILSEPNMERLAWELLPQESRGIRHPAFGSVQEEAQRCSDRGQQALLRLPHDEGPSVSHLQRGRRPNLGDPRADDVYAGRTRNAQSARVPHAMAHQGRSLSVLVPQQRKTLRTEPQARIAAETSSGSAAEESSTAGCIGLNRSSSVIALIHGRDAAIRTCLEDQGRYYLSATQKTEARNQRVGSKPVARPVAAGKPEHGDQRWNRPLNTPLSRLPVLKPDEPSMPPLPQPGGRQRFQRGAMGPCEPYGAQSNSHGQPIRKQRGRLGNDTDQVHASDCIQRCLAQCQMGDGSGGVDRQRTAPCRIHRRRRPQAGCLRGERHPLRRRARRIGVTVTVGSARLATWSVSPVGRETAPEIGNVTGGPPLEVTAAVARLRIYDRPLRISEAMGNFRAGP